LRPAPVFVEPMAARLVQRLPEGREWMYEVKLDGYRALLMKAGDTVRLMSRNSKDLTHAYRLVHAAGRKLHADSVTLDGEIVAIDREGRPSFQALQHRSPGNHVVVFYAFDVLHRDGRDLTSLTLDERRSHLPGVIGDSGVLISQELPGSAADVVEAVRALGLEGIVAKRRESRYTPGQRTHAWVKVKLELQQECVIGGYRPGPLGIDALVVGVYERGALRFAGKVRAGFTPHLRREVLASLKPLHSAVCPFSDLPTSGSIRWGGGVTADDMIGMQWVAPDAVAQIRFVEWTAEGHLRHAAFLGMRGDKAARDVRRERAGSDVD
jgi:DNA ligase D-like protein (predicted ligase)